LGYIESMKIALAQLLVLLAVIALIAGGAVAVAGLAEQASGIGAKIDVASDALIPSISGSGEITTQVLAMGQDNHHDDCGCDCRLGCVHSAGSGCCAASISDTGECSVLDCAPVAARRIAGQAFLATGIDPEALLQPPQVFA
jgi:hypothetical protein